MPGPHTKIHRDPIRNIPCADVNSPLHHSYRILESSVSNPLDEGTYLVKNLVAPLSGTVIFGNPEVFLGGLGPIKFMDHVDTLVRIFHSVVEKDVSPETRDRLSKEFAARLSSEMPDLYGSTGLIVEPVSEPSSPASPATKILASSASEDTAKSRPLPDVAPALWIEKWEPLGDSESKNSRGETLEEFDKRRAAERPNGDTPPAFITRHYGQWMTNDERSICRSDFRKLDPNLEMALRNYMRTHALPPDFQLPTQKERNTRWFRRIADELGADTTSLAQSMAKEGARALSVARRLSR